MSSSIGCTTTYITGEDVVVYKFPSKEVALEWDSLVLATKEHARVGVSLANSEKWGDDKVANHIQEWFLHVEKLESDFGTHMVPPDIVRCASGENKLLTDMGREPVKLSSKNNELTKHKNCLHVKTVLEA